MFLSETRVLKNVLYVRIWSENASECKVNHEATAWLKAPALLLGPMNAPQTCEHAEAGIWETVPAKPSSLQPEATSRGGQDRLTRVCPPVSLKLVAPGEPLAAVHPVANEGPLSAVPAQVSSQVRRLAVDLPAAGDVADVLLLLAHAGAPVRKRRDRKHWGFLRWFIMSFCSVFRLF